MAVFIGDSMRTDAVRVALNLKYAVAEIINPAIKIQYSNKTYSIQHAVGIDTCELFVARTGVRGSNDLVWVGRAANYAAKLCSLRSRYYTTYITKEIYNFLNDEAKYADDKRQKNMWERYFWQEKGITIYRSHYRWSI